MPDMRYHIIICVMTQGVGKGLPIVRVESETHEENGFMPTVLMGLRQ